MKVFLTAEIVDAAGTKKPQMSLHCRSCGDIVTLNELADAEGDQPIASINVFKLQQMMADFCLFHATCEKGVADDE
mgnify:FL=1